MLVGGKAYQDCPEVDEDEGGEVSDAVHGEDEDEEVVWDALEVAVDGVEGVRCPWSRD